ncbi:MAG: glycosyltransferase [Ornithinimicrobium sp.]|uniref:glycosyltransferase n=1 Tax=Ornithinimicrobium sp. TaxID=1977084 RepID=UPI0026DF5F70|nr:glycosyltransferase [Ornithinimicrobium sp.]MDO5739571.1 glycosyltransferase [Ornithinimicrobium sp.]
MPPARSSVGDVTVVVLAHPGTSPDSLGHLLDAIVAQTLAPQRLLICGLDPQDHEFVDARTELPVVHRPTPPGAAAADGEPQLWRVLDDARAELPVHENHWLWLLHDDSRPDPRALEALAAAVRRTSRVGLVGPKLVRADDPRLLIGVGQHITPAGRAVDQRAAALVDQGQLDLRQDVLGAPLAGVLVRSDVLADVGGLDPNFGSDGVEGLDLGWRIHLHGERVVVAPDAVVAQGPVGLGVTHPRRTRIRLRQLALARSSLLASIWRALGVLVTSSLAAVLLLLVKRTHEAADEWADVRAVFAPLRGWRARWRFRPHRRVSPADLGVLFVPRSAGLRSTVETLGEALDPRSVDASRNRAAAGTARQGTEAGPVSEEFSDLGQPAARPSRWSWPLALAALATVVLTTYHWWPLLGALRPGSSGVAGGELGAASADAAGLWRSALDGWRGGGLGHAGSAEAWLVPASALTRAVELLPGGATGTATAGVALSLVLALAAPLSVLTAYLGLRRATRRRWLRAVLALGWAGALPLTAAVSTGRVGPVVVHVLAPLLVAGYAVSSDSAPSTRRTAATFATVLGIAVAAQWVPLVLVAASLAGLLLVVGGRARARWRGLALALLPWLLMLPWLPVLWSAPSRLLGGAGATLAGDGLPAAASAWQMMLLNAGMPFDPGSWAAFPLWLSVPIWLAALGALLLPKAAGRRAGVLVGGALLTLGLAFVAPRIGLGELPAGHPQAGASVTAWPGTILSLTAAALLIAAALLLEHLLVTSDAGRAAAAAGTVRSPRARATTTLAWASCGVLSLAAVVGLTWSMVAPGLSIPGAMDTRLSRAVAPLPAVAAEQARGPLALRTLILEPSVPADTVGGDSEAAHLVSADLVGVEPEPARILRDLAWEVSGAHADPAPVAAAVSTMTGEGTPAEALAQLQALGVGYVEVRAEESDPLVTVVDRLPGMTRVSSPADRVLWRMLDNEHARVQVLAADGVVLDHLRVTGAHGTSVGRVEDLPAGAVLSASEGQGWASEVTVLVDGASVPVVQDGTAALPGGSHEVEVVLRTPALPWHLLALALAVVIAFLALPFGRSESEEKAS